MREIKLAEIERINLIILILGSILSIVLMREFKYFLSFVVGSAVMVLDFRMLRKIIESGFLHGKPSKKELLIMLPLKFFALVAAVVVFVVYGDMNVVCFLTGLSTVFLSIVISQCIVVFSPAAKRRQKDGT